LSKLGRLFGLFARLERPVDFEALDGQPVDLVFLLLAPEQAGADHLKALARVARLLRDQETARKLRESRDADAVYAVLAMPAASSAA
jgi:PTS system nitrogen regulatory IIA component